ncbi:YhcH/YjgK/YiaL family protein [Aerococcus sanguinicola]
MDHLEYTDRPPLHRVVDYLKTHDISEDEPGNHAIEEGFFYNVIAYDTTTPDQRDWESHRDYIDIHVPIKGKEGIHHNFLVNMTLGDYVEADDFQASEGPAQSELIIAPGQILVLDREDVHKTGLMVEASESIKKAVFKVKYD